MFGAVFKAHVRAMGVRDGPTSFRSPWQNGYVERLIGSIRRECTDHLLVFNAEHLRRILAKYATYYNEVRTPRFPREGCALQTARRTVRSHCRVSGPWRATPPLCPNLSFRKRQDVNCDKQPTAGERALSVRWVRLTLTKERFERN